MYNGEKLPFTFSLETGSVEIQGKIIEEVIFTCAWVKQGKIDPGVRNISNTA